MDIHKFREQLDRYLKGRTNETETAIIEAWYRSYNNEANQPMTDDAREQMRLDMKQQIGKAIGRSSNNWGFYRIAACLLVFSALGALAYLFTRPKDALKTTFVTIQTQAGQIKQFVLPDSSVIWVNAASKVRVPSRFNDNLRQVYLDEGEAFFEVKHDRSRPFKVRTVPLQVQVLGTSFNIKAYRKLTKVKVTVLNGKVGVTRGNKLLTFLTPGQQLNYLRKNGSYTQQQVAAGETQSWRDGDTYLDKVGFEELSLVFKNLYGLDLTPGDQRVHDYLFTLRIKRGLSATETLKMISLMHNTHFRKEGSNVVLY